MRRRAKKNTEQRGCDGVSASCSPKLVGLAATPRHVEMSFAARRRARRQVAAFQLARRVGWGDFAWVMLEPAGAGPSGGGGSSPAAESQSAAAVEP